MQSVRALAFDSVQLDVSLPMYGEVVDFYMRLNVLGDVVCSRSLQIKHLDYPSNRNSMREIHLYHKIVRWLVAKRYPVRISVIGVLQVTLVLVLGELTRYMCTHTVRHRASSRENIEFSCRKASRQSVVQFVDSCEPKLGNVRLSRANCV